MASALVHHPLSPAGTVPPDIIIAAYSRKRIVEEKQTSSSDKIYSIAAGSG